jgi:hypothetical protein
VKDRVPIEVEALKKVALILVDHLAQHHGDHVALEHDMFWSIPSPDIFNVYTRPDHLTIGQLSEAWESLHRMVAEDRPLVYGLVWLSDLLRALGTELSE